MTYKRSEALKKAQDKYYKEKVKQINLRLNREYDADCIEWLEKQSNRKESITRLIRNQIEHEKNKEFFRKHFPKPL